MSLQSLSIIEIEISHIRVLCDSTIVVEPSTATKPCYCSTDHMYSPVADLLAIYWWRILNHATVLLIICTKPCYCSTDHICSPAADVLGIYWWRRNLRTDWWRRNLRTDRTRDDPADGVGFSTTTDSAVVQVLLWSIDWVGWLLMGEKNAADILKSNQEESCG